MSIRTPNDALARAIVASIQRDIEGRRGFRDAWDSIDEDVRGEIIQEWRAIARQHIDKQGS